MRQRDLGIRLPLDHKRRAIDDDRLGRPRQGYQVGRDGDRKRDEGERNPADAS